MDEAQIRKELTRLEDEAVKAGIFLDAFITIVYRDGTAGTTHAACNHDGHRNDQDKQISKAIWENIAYGMTRRIDGKVPHDPKPAEHPAPVAGKA